MLIKIEEMLLKYADTFEENFPTFSVMGMSEKEIIKRIEESLKNGIPFEPEIDEDVLY